MGQSRDSVRQSYHVIWKAFGLGRSLTPPYCAHRGEAGTYRSPLLRRISDTYASVDPIVRILIPLVRVLVVGKRVPHVAYETCLRASLVRKERPRPPLS